MTNPRRPRVRTVAVACLVGVAIAVVWLFVSGSGSTSLVSSATVPPTTRRIAEPAGPTPSASAQMVCAPEAQQDIASLVGAPTTDPLTPTWIDHVYSCRYAYGDGAMLLSVKELSSRSETDTYFATLRRQLGQREKLKRMGQGAFVTKNGSVVVRKDYKVLLVDTSSLPAHFGPRSESRAQVAIGVGLTVLGCWTGA